MWVLRPELRSSARAVCTLNHERSTMTFSGLLMALLCHHSPKHLVDMLRAILYHGLHHPFPRPLCFPNSAATEPHAGTVNTQGGPDAGGLEWGFHEFKCGCRYKEHTLKLQTQLSSLVTHIRLFLSGKPFNSKIISLENNHFQTYHFPPQVL